MHRPCLHTIDSILAASSFFSISASSAICREVDKLHACQAGAESGGWTSRRCKQARLPARLTCSAMALRCRARSSAYSPATLSMNCSISDSGRWQVVGIHGEFLFWASTGSAHRP